MQTPPRRVVARLSLLLAVPMLAACGFHAQTDQVYQPAVGVNVRDSQVDVLNAMVVSSEKGSGQFIATLSNESQTHSEKLTGIEGPSGTKVSTAPSTSIPATGDLNLADGTAIVVTGSKINPVTSDFVTFHLTFDHADPVTISVPVVASTGELSKYGSGATAAGPNEIAIQGSKGAFGQ